MSDDTQKPEEKPKTPAPEKKKSYGVEMTKYQAKRFFNPLSKRFWLTAATPFLVLTSQPLTEDHTVDNYAEDTQQIDATMTANMDKYLTEYLATTAVQEGLNEAVYQDKYDGEVSPDLKAEQLLTARKGFALGNVLQDYMFNDDRMTERQFEQYESMLDQFDLGMVPANAEPYALKECKVKFNTESMPSWENERKLKECMTLDNSRDWDDVTMHGIMGFLTSALSAMLIFLAGGLLKPQNKPRRKDFKPKKPGN